MGDALKDLAIVPVTSTDTNYFLRKVTGLKIDRNYSFKFQWVLEDGTVSDWSPGYGILTPTESIPSAPSATVPSTNASYIPVTLPAFPANAKRVDVYIVGGTYGAGKVADSFLQAGTKSISVAAGTYQVSLITVSASGINGSPSNTFTITITDPTANIQTPEASKTPSAPAAKSVLGAIQVTWDGKQADGSDQPYGFNAAKVYVGTSPSFVPSASNQVDVFNFANGQNIINIGVGTLVNGVAMTYGVDYYVKIATTNGTDTSTPVSATGSPKQIGKAGSGDIISILADQIETATLSATSTITVGAAGGKRVELRGTGNPIEIYGTGGNSVLSYNSAGSKLTVKGDGEFTGSLTGASGTFGPVTIGTTGISSTNFSIASDGSAEFKGILTASGGKIGDWYINATTIRSSSSATATPRIELDPLTPQIVLAGSSGTITLSPVNGITGPDVTIDGSTGAGFSLTPNGSATLRGKIYADQGSIAGWTIASSSISKSATIVDGIFGSQTLTTTLGSNGKINLNSSGGGYLQVADSSLLSVTNAYSATSINPGIVSIKSTSTLNGVDPAFYNIQLAPGDYNIIHYWSGGGTDANGYTTVFPKWLNYSSTGARQANDIDIFDTTQQGFRPIGVWLDGTQYLGNAQYFSTSQSTTPASSLGRNGDLFFSTQ
jgi:hypothetical protein